MSRPPGDGGLPHAALKRCLLPAEERSVAATWQTRAVRTQISIHHTKRAESESASDENAFITLREIKAPTFCWGRYKRCSIVRREKDKGVLFYGQTLQHLQDPTDAAVQLHHRVAVTETQRQSHALRNAFTPSLKWLSQEGEAEATGLVGSSLRTVWRHKRGRGWHRVPSRGRRAAWLWPDEIWRQDLPAELGGRTNCYYPVHPQVFTENPRSH